MEANFELSSSQSLLSHQNEEKGIVEIVVKISEVFHSKLNFFGSGTKKGGEDSEVVEGPDNYDDEEEFSFVINSSGSMLISGNSASTDAQIQPNLPLFNRDLLLPHKDNTISENRIPSQSQVEQVLAETPSTTTLHKGKTSAAYGTSSGLYYTSGKTSLELSKKSNSTGFSKLWRSKEYLHRSQSDSSDNFIVKLYRSQKENRRRWRMKMYSHQWRNEMQNNKIFLTSAKK